MKILGLVVPFTAENAKANYRRRAMLQHPDKGGDNSGMVELNAAYELCCKGIKFPVGANINDYGVEFDFEFINKRVKVSLKSVVRWFSEIMLGKLQVNKCKGMTWRNESAENLFKRMVEEGGELYDEIKKRDKEAIIKECADVANFAMMIADNARRKL